MGFDETLARRIRKTLDGRVDLIEKICIGG
jgi:hypothetical protein